LNIRDVVRR